MSEPMDEGERQIAAWLELHSAQIVANEHDAAKAERQLQDVRRIAGNLRIEYRERAQESAARTAARAPAFRGKR